MKRSLAAALGALALVASLPASAADLPARGMPYKAPVYAPAFSWTGCYVGGHVGGIWADQDWTLRTDGANVPLGGHSADSWLGGVQAGCNYEFANRFVIGIQGDYVWSDAKGSHIDLSSADITDNTRMKSLASVTGRIGYDWNRFLGYVKGGTAWVRDEHTGTLTATGALFDSARETRAGWTVGVGGEYAFTNNISAFVEYDYYDFGTRQVTTLFPNGTVNDLIDIKQTASAVKGGVNFRFSTGL